MVHRGVEPSIHIRFKHSKIKQYFKDARALRTETTINDGKDFGVGRLVTSANFAALIAIGRSANERLLDRELQACDCAPDAATLARVVLPSADDGLPAPAVRFGEPRTMALPACLCSFQHLFEGLSNRSMRPLIAGLIPGYSPGQMTYDLRRLRRKGLIQRLPHSNRYQLTPLGRRVMVLFTKTYGRILAPGLVQLDPHLPAQLAARSPLATAWRHLDHTLDHYIDSHIAAA